ncbi:MAG: PhoH family protein [Clostridia bacterium]|nr:PhoH family protein [Clostridia bacterium]
MSRTTRRVPVDSTEIIQLVLGPFDENLNAVSQEFHVTTRIEKSDIVIEGEKDKVSLAESVIESLVSLVENGDTVDRSLVSYCIQLAKEGKAGEIGNLYSDTVAVNFRGRPIKCKTLGQKNYVAEIKSKEVVFVIGPAGTGKTYLAVAMAVQALKQREVERIILTRPAVEAGEKLGFLPGDMQMKVDPYLRPLYDALQEMLGLETFSKYVERGVIEIAPLAFMRGRTLSSSFIILDEAQNTTPEQIKMFLTRLGEGSKVVVTGDVTQIDLKDGATSGLNHAVRVLEGVEGISVCRLTDSDVVRHPMVMRIVRAYEKYEEEHKKEDKR